MRSLLSQTVRALCLGALPAAVLLTSCQTSSRNTSRAASGSSFSYAPVAKTPKNPNNVRVKVSTGRCAVYVVEGNDVLLATPAGVGTAATPTPPGNHRVTAKVAQRRRASNPDAGYPMPYWVEFQPAYGFHWGFVKPYPSTHGCIRLPWRVAPQFFNLVKVGTPINIAASQPEDATVGATLPRLDDSPLPNPPKNYLLSPQIMSDIGVGRTPAMYGR